MAGEGEGNEAPGEAPDETLSESNQTAAVSNSKKHVKLSHIERTDLAADFHPAMSHVDDLAQEIKFHFALVRDTWTMNHVRALTIGILAFLIGSISEDIISGGNTFVSGPEGVRGLGGFGFFQVLVSIALWIWFVIELWKLFPIMKGHSINLLVTWGAGMLGMILFHIPNPNFPLNIVFGDLLGGLVGIAAMIFFSFIVKMAVTETRDEHVRVRHFTEDPREIATQMREHSLKAWAGSFILWFIFVLVNTWAGVHFIAERHADRYLSLAIHLISGVYLIAATMHILWFPQMMLGAGTTKVLSHRARTSRTNESEASSGDTNRQEIQGELNPQVEPKAEKDDSKNQTFSSSNKAASGFCPECKSASAIHRMEGGDAFVPCPNDECDGGGSPLSNCPRCKTSLPARYSCPTCSINAPVADFLPNVEAW